jgi:DNA helicase II / ATP-dependent DNA helicase PcrA
VPSIGSIRSPVAPWLHVLTAHKGKGQEFDWVFVIGLEEGVIPDFRTKDQEQFDEELRILHVMVSRARYGLVFSSIRRITTQYGTRKDKDPSPCSTCCTAPLPTSTANRCRT